MDTKTFWQACNQHYSQIISCASSRYITGITYDTILNIIDYDKEYTVFTEGVNKCLKKFIESPEWRNINWRLNFWMDNITGEKTKIWDADGLKEKARYVKYCIKK